MESIFNFFKKVRLNRMEKKLRKYKPKLLDSWYDKLDNEIRQEYEKEMEDQEDKIYRLQKDVAQEHRNAEYWHGKYDAQKEVYDGIKNNMIQKVESTAMKAGKQEEQIKNLKSDLKDKE